MSVDKYPPRVLKEIERMRSRARHNEASALSHAREEERQKWQFIVADMNTALSEKDKSLSEKDKLIAELQARLAKVE